MYLKIFYNLLLVQKGRNKQKFYKKILKIERNKY